MRLSSVSSKNVSVSQILQVSNVLAHDRVVPLGQAEGVLQLSSAGQKFRQIHLQPDGLRRIPSGPPQDTRLPFEGADHRIIHAHEDIAIVQQAPVGDRRKKFQGSLIGDNDRLLAEIAAGHHEGIVRRTVEQQMMQGGVREHHAQGPISGRDGGGNVRVFARQHDDGMRRALAAPNGPGP